MAGVRDEMGRGGLGDQRGVARRVATLTLLGSRGRPVLSFPCSLYPVVPVNSRVVVDKEIEVGGFLFPKNVSGAGEPGFPGRPHRPVVMRPPTCMCRPSLCSATTWFPGTLTSTLSLTASSPSVG